MIKINGSITQTSSIQGNIIKKEDLKGTSKTIEDVNGNYENDLEIKGDGKIPEYLFKEEKDPTVPDHVKKITIEDIERWDNPEIPKTEEVDPTVPEYVKQITQEDINKWNNPEGKVKDVLVNGESVLDEKGNANIPVPEVDNDYNKSTNKPSINGITLAGNKTAQDLGLQPIGNYAMKYDIPTNLSQLNNDTGYLTYDDAKYNMGLISKYETYHTELLNIEYIDYVPSDYEQNKIYMVNGVPYGYKNIDSEPITMQIWWFEGGGGGPGEVFTYQLANDPNLVSKACYWANGGIDYEAEVQPMPELMTFDTISSIGQDTITTSMGAIYRKYQEIKFVVQTGGFGQLTEEDDLTSFIKDNVSNWYLEDKLNELNKSFEEQIGNINTLLIDLNTGSGV